MTDQQPAPNDHHAERSPAHEALQWLAFCYISDELSSEDRVEFELRLSHDQRAREAVADAVQQAQVLYTSLNSTSFNDGREPVLLAGRHSVSSRSRWQPSNLLFAAAAALLMMVAGWALFTGQFANEAITDNDQEGLASAWVATLVVMDDDDLNDFLEDELPLSESDELVSDDWMIAAVNSMENPEGDDRETN